jgi:hypothetical protein
MSPRKWFATIHAIVKCEDCTWQTGSYKNAQALAKIHAKKYGHRVHGELAIGFGYDFRDSVSVKPLLKGSGEGNKK